MKGIADQSSDFIQFLMGSTQYVVTLIRPLGDDVVKKCVEAELEFLGLKDVEPNMDFVEMKYNAYKKMDANYIHSVFPIPDGCTFFEFSIGGRKGAATGSYLPDVVIEVKRDFSKIERTYMTERKGKNFNGIMRMIKGCDTMLNEYRQSYFKQFKPEWYIVEVNV